MSHVKESCPHTYQQNISSQYSILFPHTHTQRHTHFTTIRTRTRFFNVVGAYGNYLFRGKRGNLHLCDTNAKMCVDIWTSSCGPVGQDVGLCVYVCGCVCVKERERERARERERESERESVCVAYVLHTCACVTVQRSLYIHGKYHTCRKERT